MTLKMTHFWTPFLSPILALRLIHAMFTHYCPRACFKYPGTDRCPPMSSQRGPKRGPKMGHFWPYPVQTPALKPLYDIQLTTKKHLFLAIFDPFFDPFFAPVFFRWSPEESINVSNLAVDLWNWKKWKKWRKKPVFWPTFFTVFGPIFWPFFAPFFAS